MKYLYLLLFAGILSSCSSAWKDYPALDGVIRSYFWDNYSYPETIDDIVLFRERTKDSEPEGWKYYYDKQIRDLKRNRKRIKVECSEGYFKLIKNGELYFSTPMFDPCDEITGYNKLKGEIGREHGTYVADVIFKYYDRPLFLTMQGNNIMTEELVREFRREMAPIGKSYPYIVLRDGIEDSAERTVSRIKYCLVEYRPETGIFPFCPFEDFDKYPYFKDLEKKMSEFSEKYDLKRIVFLTPIGY